MSRTHYSRSSSAFRPGKYIGIVGGILAALGLAASFAGASLVPPDALDEVVALGSLKPFMPLPGQPCTLQWQTEGTGFLYGYLVRNDPDPRKRQYEVYLVTARHVIEEHAASEALAQASGSQPASGTCNVPANGDSISVRLNPSNPTLPGRQFDLPIKEWFFHPNAGIDLAAIRINPSVLKPQGLVDTFMPNDQVGANKEKIRSLKIAAGDGVFVLGFPMNLAGAQRNYVIVRQGCIARITDMLNGVSPGYLVDAFVFPGNSGSPVILRPEMTSITGTPPQSSAYLIGMIISYLPYTDVAISAQTRRPRVSFEENSGLAEVLPTDYIDEAIAAWRASQPSH